MTMTTTTDVPPAAPLRVPELPLTSSSTEESDVGCSPYVFASKWLSSVRRAVEAARLPWHDPHVSGDEDEIALEWARGRRNVTVYIRGYLVEVLKVAGPNLENDIGAYYVLNADDAVELWRWLRGE